MSHMCYRPFRRRSLSHSCRWSVSSTKPCVINHEMPPVRIHFYPLFPSTTYLYGLASCLCILYILKKWINRHISPLPPGPEHFPLVGGLFSFPTTHIGRHFADYKHMYGPISSISVFRQHFVILNDRETAFDLLDRRSATYSDCADFPFATMCAGVLEYSGRCFHQQFVWQVRYDAQFGAVALR